MNKLTLIIFLVFLTIISCDNSIKLSEFKLKENELEKDDANNKKKVSKREKLNELITDTSTFEQILEINRNLVQGENKKFIVRVDRLLNNQIMYRSWNKPKTTSEKPDLQLSNGIIDKQGTGGGYHYIFKNGEWKYIIEENLMGESEESVGLFLKLIENDKEKLFSRLNDITIIDSEKDYYMKSDLTGSWWTPHYAVRKIEFFKNNRFEFNDGHNNISNGNFTFSNKKVSLLFDSNKDNIVMKIGGGKNDYSYTLVGDGENFVNER